MHALCYLPRAQKGFHHHATVLSGSTTLSYHKPESKLYQHKFYCNFSCKRAQVPKSHLKDGFRARAKGLRNLITSLQ